MNKISGISFTSIFLIVFSCSLFSEEPEHVGSLISACSDGQMDICDQISLLEHPSQPASPLDAMAMNFAKHSDIKELEEDKVPNLGKAYSLIIRDYFSNENIAEEKREKWFKEAALENCSAHYHVKWRMEKNWWPVDKNEDPDWRAIYPHVLDHYFGYCVYN